MLKKWLCLLLMVGIGLLLPAATSADVGPKPSLNFEFEYEGDVVEVVSGQLLVCEDKACTNPKPLPGPGLGCGSNSCYAYWGSTLPYYKLQITFADKMRESQIFTKINYAATFTVTVQEDSLVVQERFLYSVTSNLFSSWSLTGLVVALLATLLVELSSGFVYKKIRSLTLPIKYIALVNLISLPLLWAFILVTPVLMPGWVLLMIGEIAVFAGEGWLFYKWGNQHQMGYPPLKIEWQDAWGLSLVNNLLSIAAGFVWVWPLINIGSLL